MLGERVQVLWGGYGEIRRAMLSGTSPTQVIVKYVVPPSSAGEDAAASRSRQRKLRSYEVECAFYREYAGRCGSGCRAPAGIATLIKGDRVLLILEDLDAAGFDERRGRVSPAELRACLRWLAQFHATFLGAEPRGLWKVGTYWHLATRPDELRALPDGAVRRAAPELDGRLNRARYRTLVHGDAKLQNFCFGRKGSSVAAVDFQYVGAGVGVQDLAYFLSSCLTASELERDANRYIDDYFRELGRAVQALDPAVDVAALEVEWRTLYPIACADFYRFLLGWLGGADANDSYLERVTRRALALL